VTETDAATTVGGFLIRLRAALNLDGNRKSEGRRRDTRCKQAQGAG